MQTITPQNLSIYKFCPDNILMIHKATKHIYQYFQTPILAPKEINLTHEHLLQGSFLPTGIIYQKGITSMGEEISKRMKATNKQFYEEEELVNTFLPVLLCLQYLHQKNLVHGSVCPQNIIFNEEGDVLLRDWLLQVANNKYYDVQKHKDRTQSDDIYALGQILLEASTLTYIKAENKSPLSHQNALKKIIPKYSRGYILAIYIMLKKNEKFYPYLENMLKNNDAYIDGSEQLVAMFKKIKGQKQFKPLISPILNYTNFKYLELISRTPVTAKKVPKIEDAENKKNFQDTKKKNIERVSKITQKILNSETPKKPDMALKRMSNMKIINWQQNQKSIKKIVKQDVLKFGSPLKRLKTFSRKKAL